MARNDRKITEAVVQAVDLVRRVRDLEAELESCKRIIRRQAIAIARRKGDEELVEFNSPVGVASVCFVQPGVSLIKGTNVLELRDQLTELTWDDLFAVEVVPARGFNDRFDHLSKKDQATIRRYVQWQARQPRVTLPKQPFNGESEDGRVV